MKACKKLTAFLAALTMLTGMAGLPVSAEEMTGTLGDTMTWTVDGDTVRCTWESAAADGVEISIQGDTCTIEKGVYSWEEYQEWSNAAANELTELLEANGYDPSAMGSEEKNAAIAELMPEAYAVRTAFTGIKHIVVSDGVTQLDAPLGFLGFGDSETVQLGNSVVSIGDSTFENTHCTRIILPDSLKIIGNQAFLNAGVKELTIPAGVEEIGDMALETDSALEKVTILSRDVDLTDTGLGYVSVWLETNPYRNENLVIYGYAGSTAEQYAADNAIPFVTLAETPVYGDVNLDGRVDIQDAVLLAKAAAGTVTLNSDAKVNGDCDQDGTISQADAAILMQFLVHLVDELPVQGA